MAIDDIVALHKTDPAARVSHPQLHPNWMSSDTYKPLDSPSTPGATVLSTMRNALTQLNVEALNIGDANAEFSKDSSMSSSELLQWKRGGGKTVWTRVEAFDDRGNKIYRELERPVLSDAQADKFIRALDDSIKRSGNILLATRNTIDETIGSLEKRIESALSDPNSNAGGHVAYGVEVRSMLFNTKPLERLGVAQSLLNSGDIRVISSMLNSPLALTGLTPEQHAILKAEAQRKLAPADTAQLAAAHAARKQLEFAKDYLLERYTAARPMPSKSEAAKGAAIERLAAGTQKQKEVA